MKLSEFTKTLSIKLTKSFSEAGIVFLNQRVVAKNIEIDEEDCDKILKQFMINKFFVLRYLKMKYIPTYVENGMHFRNQTCIQKVFVQEDGTMQIFIHHSEPHKVITDSIYVRNLLIAQGYTLNNKANYIIDRVQLMLVDLLLYIEVLKEWNVPVPSTCRQIVRFELFKIKKFETILMIKAVKIKRKYLRYYLKLGRINRQELRECLKVNFKIRAEVFNLSARIRNDSFIRTNLVWR